MASQQSSPAGSARPPARAPRPAGTAGQLAAARAASTPSCTTSSREPSCRARTASPSSPPWARAKSPNHRHDPLVLEELDLIARCVERDVPVLGLCFGGQALAAVLGGTVEVLDAPELGWHRIESAAPDVVAAGPWLQWHYDAFRAPPGAEELARSPVCSQAFRHRPAPRHAVPPRVHRRHRRAVGGARPEPAAGPAGGPSRAAPRGRRGARRGRGGRRGAAVRRVLGRVPRRARGDRGGRHARVARRRDDRGGERGICYPPGRRPVCATMRRDPDSIGGEGVGEPGSRVVRAGDRNGVDRPGAVPRPPRRAARQGRAGQRVRPRRRPRHLLLQRRDGHRPPAHPGGRRRGGLPRHARGAGHEHADRDPVGARRLRRHRRPAAGRRGPRRADGPARRAAARGRGVRGARLLADHRARARVLPLPRRRERASAVLPLRRPPEHGLHGGPAGGSRRHRAQAHRDAGEPRDGDLRGQPRVQQQPVRDQPARGAGAEGRRPRLPPEVGGQGRRRAQRARRHLHGQAVQRPGRLRLPRARVARARRRRTPSSTRTIPTGSARRCARSWPACCSTLPR